ncbi:MULTISPECIES: hypothetical protein [unclassified Bradyrhizobium]|jgi:hypothetical protein|uniref:hypothetical protein n=1 Tax=unclassified Bradyrhizobium TaxID=2631580 RepID=UPI001FFB9649|nr:MULTISPECIES: hypothetical protein [unclassified Bradyrhizobium]MCK1521567.1 hypothetical protein [Bradyrhizobium sp. 17]MCK1539988.1 hypothetical protein [Bradyrhizobium sp. 176]MCK1561660.1 hypothetical protein [Bradyrhizobium sp. 171]UPJ28967.1 hypothetical protein IVB54_08055 [Bradyrhizobium sp. CW1]
MSASSLSCFAPGLEARGLRARRLALLFGPGDDVQAVRVGTSMATRDVKRLTRLVGDQIEKVR